MNSILNRAEPLTEFSKACLQNMKRFDSGEIDKETFLETAITLSESVGEDCEDLKAQLYNLRPEPF